MKQVRIVEFLVAAKKLIDTPDKWTTAVMARDVDNMPVATGNDRACKFCSLGALFRAFLTNEDSAYYENVGHSAEVAIRNQLPPQYADIGTFNDTRSHSEVMELWDKTIAAEQKKLVDWENGDY